MNYLQQDGIKSQLRAQIENMLKARGFDFDRIAAVFENVYAESIDQLLSGMIQGTESADIEFSTNELLESFVDAFNENIVSAINGMNSSDADFDVIDIDYSVISEGTDDAEQIEDAYNENKNYTNTNKEKIFQNLDNMFVQIKPQMLRKARVMCQANGIEFNNKEFEAIFNSAESVATVDALSSYENDISFNPRTVITTFTTEFKSNYTTWVEKQKTGKKV